MFDNLQINCIIFWILAALFTLVVIQSVFQIARDIRRNLGVIPYGEKPRLWLRNRTFVCSCSKQSKFPELVASMTNVTADDFMHMPEKVVLYLCPKCEKTLYIQAVVQPSDGSEHL